MAIELQVVQFWSEIILVISNRTRAAHSFNFEIMRMISDQIALHSVQLPLLILLLITRNQALLTIFPLHYSSKMSASLQRHHSVFANLLIHANLQVSLKSLVLLLSLDKTLPDKVSSVIKMCSNCVVLFYKLLHKMEKQDGQITGTRVICSSLKYVGCPNEELF